MPLVNALTSQIFGHTHPIGATENASSSSNTSTISQEKYDQLVSLLQQQVNLLPSSHPYTTNHI